MIRKADEWRIRKVENPMGGHGTVYFHDWLIPEEEVPGHGRVISKVVITPGAAIGIHTHQGEWEAYYVLSGEGIVTEYGQDFPLCVGDVHLCKNGETHGIRNETEEDLVLNALILNDLSKE